MFHNKRTWGPPQRIESLDELAEKLTQHTWTLCTVFEHRGYLYLNDATSEDGAQEYAIVKRILEGYIQTESVTFGWCSKERAMEHIAKISNGELDTTQTRVEVRFDNAPNHRCGLCA